MADWPPTCYGCGGKVTSDLGRSAPLFHFARWRHTSASYPEFRRAQRNPDLIGGTRGWYAQARAAHASPTHGAQTVTRSADPPAATGRLEPGRSAAGRIGRGPARLGYRPH